MIRLIWIAAAIFALFSADAHRTRRLTFHAFPRISTHQGWLAFLLGSIAVGLLYWPEVWPGGIETWLDDFWGLLLIVLILRGIAMLEALHHQTSQFPFWSRMMLGVFLVVSALVLILAVWRQPETATSLDSFRDQFLRFRRYIQLWIGLVAALTTVFYWGVRQRYVVSADRHALIVGLLSLNYGLVGLIDMTTTRSPAFVLWEQSLSFLVDAALYIVWGFWVAPHISRLSWQYQRTGTGTPATALPYGSSARQQSVPGPVPGTGTGL